MCGDPELENATCRICSSLLPKAAEGPWDTPSGELSQPKCPSKLE